uniref:Small ribosomal subunit protein uS3m n=1 Tax=Tricholomella constricta TaxID=117010 RepID=A0A386TYV9_9AGAR|nr:ribosomal protein S3 [Tricholomella constricta]AYE93423.1 ribosomal protein S3 [Tricholomella constricta]
MNNLKNLSTYATNKIIITKNEYSDINLDNRIIPLFSSSVYLKEKSLKKRNKYNFALLNPQKKLTSKVISFKEILSLFLKGFNIYNFNLNKYLLQHKKLDLMENLLLRESKNSASSDSADEYYKLNLRLNKFLFILNKFMPVLKYRSFLYKVSLFFPKRLLKPQPYVSFSYRLRNLHKIFLFLNKKALLKKIISDPIIIQSSTNSTTYPEIKIKENNYFNLPQPIIKGSLLDLEIQKHKRQKKIQRRLKNKFFNKGLILLKDLDLLIIKKQILIKNLLKNTESINNLTQKSVVADQNNKEKTQIKKNSYSILQQIKEKEKNILLNKQPFSSTLSNPNYYSLSFSSLGKVYNLGGIDKLNDLSSQSQKEETSNKNQIINNKNSILKTHSTYSNPVSLFYYSSTSAGTAIIAESAELKEKNNNSNSNNLINNDKKETLNIENKPILNQYLKEMSIYNMSSKGIFIYYSNLIGFNFNRENNKLYKNIYKLLAASFKSMYCLISKPVFIITPDKIIIQLFYYLFIPNILKLKKFYKYNSSYGYGAGVNKNLFKGRDWFNRKKKIKKQYSKFRKIKLNVRIKLRNLSNITLTKIFSNKFKDLCLILNNLFKKPVEFDLIRLHYPYNDSNILVNLLGIMINKIKLRIIIRRLFEKAVIKNLNKLSGNKISFIPAFLSGITIRVAGRLLTHRVVPRQTVKTTRRGASAKGKINFKDVATYTNKNKRGAFSITVKSGQNFF